MNCQSGWRTVLQEKKNQKGGGGEGGRYFKPKITI